MCEYSSDVHWFFYPLRCVWNVGCLEPPAELIESARIDRPAEGSGQSPSRYREVEASCVGVDPRTAPRRGRRTVDPDLRHAVLRGSHPDQAHKLIARGLPAAADARPLGMGGLGARIHTVTSFTSASCIVRAALRTARGWVPDGRNAPSNGA